MSSVTVTLADAQDAADLLGDDHPAQGVDAPDDTGSFHMQKPSCILSVFSDSIYRRVFVIPYH